MTAGTDFPPPPPPAPAKPKPDVPTWLLLALVLVIIGASVVVGVQVWKLVDPDIGGPPHPDAWDPRVAPYAEQAERLRGLEFKEPVYVDFLKDAEFRKEVTSKEGDLTAAEREELTAATKQLQAIGLLAGAVDLERAINTLSGEGVLGLYDPEDERIRLRGDRLTLAVKSTLVHELVHALQDQHFSIGDRFDELEEKAEGDGAESDRAVAELTGFDAIVEGDARRIESVWADRLSARQKKDLEAEERATRQAAMKAMKGVPEVLLTFISMPYDLGEAHLAAAADGEDLTEGNDTADDLLRRPPVSEEQLVDPWAPTTVTVRRDVATPQARDGEKKTDSGEFGALGWYFMLAERIPANAALRAVDGWGGDRYLSYDEGDRSCMRINWTGDGGRDRSEMATALRQWIAARKGWPASLAVDGTTLTFQTCAPGGKVRATTTRSMDSVVVLLTRIYLTDIGLDGGFSDAQARCFADRSIAALTPAQLTTGDFDESVMRNAAIACR